MKRDALPGPILGRYVDDRFDEGIFRLHPAVYSDPELFELEMKYIFERTWIFLALESQVQISESALARLQTLVPVAPSATLCEPTVSSVVLLSTTVKNLPPIAGAMVWAAVSP